MLKNYLKLAFRNVARQKTLSFINISGLAVGMACCFLIMMFVMHELSFDRFHNNSERIYRLITEDKVEHSGTATTPYILATKLPYDFPEFEQIVRVSRRNNEKLYLQDKNAWFDVKNVFSADSCFFKVFAFPLLAGNPSAVLRDPHSAVITTALANKLFGARDVIGKVLHIKIGKSLYPLTVTGIMQPLPENTQFNSNMICSMDVLEESCEIYKMEILGMSFDFFQERGAKILNTFVLLQETKTKQETDQKFTAFAERHIPEDFRVTYQLQPLKDIHLYSIHLQGTGEEVGDIRKMYLFSAIALLILLIGCINYIILATARSAGRAKEIGVRKVIGATRPDLIKQSIGESIFVACTALPVAVILVELILPVFNAFTLRKITLDLLHNWSFLAGFMVITALVGILSGSYIAFYITGFNPVQVLYKQKVSHTSKSLLRKGLIVTQVTVFIVLIFCTCVMYRQLFYLDHKELGFNKHNLLSVSLEGIAVKSNYLALKQTLLQNSAIQYVSAGSGAPPFQVGLTTKINLENLPDAIDMEWVAVDYDYIETLGMIMKEGRAFSEQYGTDIENAIIVNEAAANKLLLKSAVGSEIVFGERKRQIIGVVQDFHKGSLTQKIVPVILLPIQEFFSRLVIRPVPGKQQEAIAYLNRVWEQFYSDNELRYEFVEESLENLYQTERSLARLMLVSTSIAVIIAALGLFGLALFMAEQRTKEIGIRKVIGASVSDLVLLFYKEFFLLIVYANIIAFPVAVYFINKWLQNYAYRIHPGWWMFLVTGLLALLLTLMVTGWQALRVAARNPVETLRYE